MNLRLARDLVLTLTFGVGAGLGATTALALDDPNATCLECHGQEGIEGTLRGGGSFPVLVDPKAWAGSVHGQSGLSCVDCHAAQSQIPHPDVTEKTRRDLTLRYYTVCQVCHEENYKKQLDSIHQKTVASGNKEAAVCTDCHNPHTQTRITEASTGKVSSQARVRIPETCARCHGKIAAAYRGSVHGSALLGEGNLDVPTCVDCHGVHNIADPRTASFRSASPALCAGCHTDRAKMKRYGLSTDVLRSYVADFHGTTVTLFQKEHPDQMSNKPVCFDCHGVHDIASKNDPTKGLRVRENLLRACQKCHPGASANFPDAWLSHYIPSPEKTPLVYWVNAFYRLVIPGTVGGMLAWVTLDFVRRRIDRRREKRSSL